MTRDEVLLRLWPKPESCSQARHATRQFCAARGLSDLSDDAELLTSEVVSNAVRYTDGMVTVLLAIVGRSLAVTVTDSSINVVNGGGSQSAPSLPDPMGESGRGLFVVASIAGDWGITPSGNGKTVWFRLP